MMPINIFSSLCMYEKHRRLANEVYIKFPQKIKNIISKRNIHVTDIYYASKNPVSRVNNEPLGLYEKNTKSIHIIPKRDILSDSALKGLVAHEMGHAYIDISGNLILRLIFKIKFFRIPEHLRSHNYEEDYADWLAKKWGFVEEINALNKERTIHIN